MGGVMKVRWLGVLVAAGVVSGMSGCSSYRLAGGHEPIVRSKIPDVKFRLQNYEGMPAARNHGVGKIASRGCSIVQSCGQSVWKGDLEKVLLSAYPDLFSTDSSAIPINVSVALVDSKCDDTSSSLSEILLMLVPGGYEFTESCSVSVSVDGVDSSSMCPETIRLKSFVWQSITPLGWKLPSAFDGYNGVEYAETDSFMNHLGDTDKCQGHMTEVFTSEVSAGIVLALTRLDPNELKRIGILRNLSNE